MADPSVPPLQPLRITAGWTVQYNNAFYEIDPDPLQVPEAQRWWIFKEDMLQLRHKNNRLIDLGFYREGDLEHGEYGLVVYEGTFTGTLLHEFRSRSRLAVVDEIERLCREVTVGRL